MPQSYNAGAKIPGGEQSRQPATLSKGLLRGVKSAKMLSAYIVRRRAGSAVMAVAFVALLTIVCSSIAVLHLERDVPNANITTAEDALWWSAVTITTVGFGDHCPVSAGSKLVAILTMTVSVGLFGTFTAFVATWFIEPGEQQKDDEFQRMRKALESIEEKLNSLQDQTARSDSVRGLQELDAVEAEVMAR